MQSKITDLVRFDLLYLAIAIPAIFITIEIFYLMFLFTRTIDGGAIVKQIPNLLFLVQPASILYLLFRFVPIVANNFRLTKRENYLFVCGNIFFGVGFALFLMVLSVEDPSPLAPLILIVVALPSLLLAGIFYISGLQKILIRWHLFINEGKEKS